MKRVNIPLSFKLMGHTIHVSWEHKLFDDNGHRLYGSFDMDNLEITLDDAMPESLAEETFLHEVIEAVNVLSEIKLPHNYIQIMSGLIYQALTSGVYND